MAEHIDYLGLAPNESALAYQEPRFLLLIKQVSYATALEWEDALHATELTLAAILPQLPPGERSVLEGELPSPLRAQLRKVAPRRLSELAPEVAERFQISLTEAERIPIMVQDVLETVLGFTPNEEPPFH